MPRVNPALPAISGDIYRLSVLGISDGQQTVTSFEFQAADFAAFPGSDSAVFGASWYTNNRTTWLNCLTGFWTEVGLEIQCLNSTTAPTVVIPPPGGPQNGAQAGGALPLTVAAIMSRYTPTKGQHGRGRSYMPSVPLSFAISSSTPDRLNPTGAAAYAALATTLQSTIVSGARNAIHVVATRNKVFPYVTQRAQAVVQYRFPVPFGNARRRRFGRGS